MGTVTLCCAPPSGSEPYCTQSRIIGRDTTSEWKNVCERRASISTISTHPGHPGHNGERLTQHSTKFVAVLDKWRKEQKPAAERARKEDHREANSARMIQRHGRRVRDSSREKFKAGKYCRSTRVVLRAPNAGWPPEEGSRVDTNLRLEV